MPPRVQHPVDRRISQTMELIFLHIEHSWWPFTRFCELLQFLFIDYREKFTSSCSCNCFCTSICIWSASLICKVLITFEVLVLLYPTILSILDSSSSHLFAWARSFVLLINDLVISSVFSASTVLHAVPGII